MTKEAINKSVIYLALSPDELTKIHYCTWNACLSHFVICRYSLASHIWVKQQHPDGTYCPFTNTSLLWVQDLFILLNTHQTIFSYIFLRDVDWGWIENVIGSGCDFFHLFTKMASNNLEMGIHSVGNSCACQLYSSEAASYLEDLHTLRTSIDSAQWIFVQKCKSIQSIMWHKKAWSVFTWLIYIDGLEQQMDTLRLQGCPQS